MLKTIRKIRDVPFDRKDYYCEKLRRYDEKYKKLTGDYFQIRI